MDQFFHTLLTMSATAAIAALVVMVLRLPLKKAPRYLTCLLWLVVLFRMVCPVSFQSPVSIMPQAISTETYAQLTLPTENIAPVTPAEPTTPERVAPTAPTAAPSETSPTLTQVLLPLWAVGCGGMGLWVVLSYEKLRRATSIPLRCISVAGYRPISRRCFASVCASTTSALNANWHGSLVSRKKTSQIYFYI